MYTGLKDTQPLRLGSGNLGSLSRGILGALHEASWRRACAEPLCRHPFAGSTESYNPSEGARGRGPLGACCVGAV